MSETWTLGEVFALRHAGFPFDWLESLGLSVNRLIRVSFGPFQLLDLEPGGVESIKRRVLIEQLGPRVAAELGLSAEDEEERRTPRGGKPKRKPKGGA